MRVTSEIWVKAFLRRVASAGHFATVVRHGDDTAGAIFIKVVRRDRTARLFGPAFAGLHTADAERRFMPIFDGEAVDEERADAYLAEQQRYDSDLWVVEVERPDGEPMLDEWLDRS